MEMQCDPGLVRQTDIQLQRQTRMDISLVRREEYSWREDKWPDRTVQAPSVSTRTQTLPHPAQPQFCGEVHVNEKLEQQAERT